MSGFHATGDSYFRSKHHQLLEACMMVFILNHGDTPLPQETDQIPGDRGVRELFVFIIGNIHHALTSLFSRRQNQR